MVHKELIKVILMSLQIATIPVQVISIAKVSSVTKLELLLRMQKLINMT